MKKSLLVITLGLVLTACGGGGSGGGSGSSSSAQSAQPSNINTQAVTNSLTLVRADLQEQVKALKQIDINGTAIDLASENVGFVERDLGNGLKARAYNLPYSAIGYVLPKDVKTDKYGRVIDSRVSAEDTSELGLATAYKDLPTSGTFTYTGVAFGANSQGLLTLNADFGTTKMVSGSISDRKLISSGANLSEITLLPTDIKQYVYNGEEVHFVGAATANVEGYTVRSAYGGKFMGPNAEEVVGYVADDYGNPYEAFIGKK